MKIRDKVKKNTMIIFVITIVLLYIILRKDAKAIIDAFKTIDIKYIIISIFFFLLSIALKGYSNYLITNNKNKISIKEAIKHNLIAQFFNGITPFSSGGQPMEIYMITEHDISVASATNMTIQSFIFYQISLVICGLIAVIYNYFYHLFPENSVLKGLVLLGFIINVIVAIILLLISSSRKVTKKLSKATVKITNILHIKTDKEKIETSFLEYYEGFKKLKKRKGLFIKGLILNILSLLSLYIIPLFVLYSMNDFTSLNAIETITASSYVYLIGAFVPIPGASGGIEYGFTKFFGTHVSPNLLSAVMLIWRFITYYLAIILGALLFNIEKGTEKR